MSDESKRKNSELIFALVILGAALLGITLGVIIVRYVTKRRPKNNSAPAKTAFVSKGDLMKGPVVFSEPMRGGLYLTVLERGNSRFDCVATAAIAPGTEVRFIQRTVDGRTRVESGTRVNTFPVSLCWVIYDTDLKSVLDDSQIQNLDE